MEEHSSLLLLIHMTTQVTSLNISQSMPITSRIKSLIVYRGKSKLFRKNSLKNSYIVNGNLAIMSEMAQK